MASARGSFVFTLLFLCGLFITGCGSGSSNNNNNNQTPVLISPASSTVGAGQSTAYTVTLQAATVPNSPVTLNVSNLPSGATATFSPAQLTFPNNGTLLTSTLNIALASSTPSGTYNFTIQAVSGGLTFGTAQGTLTVGASGGQSFALSVSPSAATVSTALPANFTITVTPINGFAENVVLTVSGAANNLSVSPPAPNTLNLAGQTQATSVFSVNQTAGSLVSAPATYTVTATGGGVTQTVTVLVQP